LGRERACLEPAVRAQLLLKLGHHSADGSERQPESVGGGLVGGAVDEKLQECAFLTGKLPSILL
jgi:hypothetical protein